MDLISTARLLILVAVAVMLLISHEGLAWKFNRTIRLRDMLNKKRADEKNRTGKDPGRLNRWGKKAITKVMKLASHPFFATTTPTAPWSREFMPEKPGYNPCKEFTRCMNGGTCVPKGGGYHCNCRSAYWGPQCEFLSDKSACHGNLCQNGAICYSKSSPRHVPNLHYNATSRAKDNPAMINVHYECWCRADYFGAFCQHGHRWDNEECRVNKCSGNGHGANDTWGPNCLCECDFGYQGERCDEVTPCRDMFCTNEAKCVVNEDGTAKCECPTSVQVFGEINVTGDDCETVNAPDEWLSNPDFPCQNNSARFFGELDDSGSSSDEQRSSNGQGSTPDCLNGGRCEIIIGPIDRGTLHLLPSCICQEEYTGLRCERERSNACEDSDPCGEHGECSFSRLEGRPRCFCHIGYAGPFCTKRNPCEAADGKTKCGDGGATCVTAEQFYSDSAVGTDGDSLTHRCVCRANERYNKTNMQCDSTLEGHCMRSDGQSQCENNMPCHPCSTHTKDDDGCSDDEKRRGFKCICPANTLPPLCRKKAHPCEAHNCQNGATCRELDSINFKCVCAPGWAGPRCTELADVCVAEGNVACGDHGRCTPTSTLFRGFRCLCDEDWVGRNCQIRDDPSFGTRVCRFLGLCS